VTENEEFVLVIESENLENIAAITIEMIYDPEVLELLGCTKDPNGAFDIPNCNPEFADDRLRFNIVSISPDGVTGDITIAEMVFKAIGTNGDSSDIEVILSSFANPAGTDLRDQTTVRNGSVTIAAARRGDVTCDNILSPVDALFILQGDIGLREASEGCKIVGRNALPFNTSRCDVNNDNQCNAIDTLLILQCDVEVPNVLCPTHAEP